VHLTVADLERAVGWYERALGLRARGSGAAEAELGDETGTVLVLHEDVQAHPPGRHTGLYHYALLYPSRAALARACLRLIETRTPVSGASDHRTHEAIYLPDADGIGIELAADRPRDQWPEGLGYGRPLQPLDLDGLLAAIDGESAPARVDDGLRIGHVHLHVGDVEEALRFYRDVLGFELQAHRGTGAFVSAGGYHHHVGVNVWNGVGATPPPPHTAGLRHWTIELPAAADLAALRARADAAGIEVRPAGGGIGLRDPWQTAVIVNKIFDNISIS
jgi:catechol 2,3-dioxygenase